MKHYGFVTYVNENGALFDILVFPRKQGSDYSSMKQMVKTIDVDIENGLPRLYQWYELAFEEKTKKISLRLSGAQPFRVISVQPFRIEAQFKTDSGCKVLSNLATVTPIDHPEFVGKFIYCVKDTKLPNGTCFWKGKFEIIQDNSMYAGMDFLKEDPNICFVQVESAVRIDPPTEKKEKEKIERNEGTSRKSQKTTIEQRTQKLSDEDKTSITNAIVKILNQSVVLTALKSDNVELYRELVNLRDQIEEEDE